MHDREIITGRVVAELRGPDGRLKGFCVTHNLITNQGDRCYAEQASGFAGALAKPTGAKLGTGGGAPAKLGAGSALTTYLTDSHQAINGGFPTSTLNANKREIVYQYLWAAAKATSAATAITEAVIVNDALANATSPEANTLARVLLTGLPSKQAVDTLLLSWTHIIGS